MFNATEYWNDMPAYKDAARVIRELHDLYRFRIMIFTYRPWPNPEAYEGSMSTTQWRTRNTMTWGATRTPAPGSGYVTRMWNGWLEISRPTAMTSITKDWLRKHGFVHDKLVVERGNIYVADVRSHGHNRFRFAEVKELRIFVEDDLSKARKLADICDIVYLIDQPYNHTTDLE